MPLQADDHDESRSHRHVAADGLAVIVGQQLGARLPERTSKLGAAVAFVAFGVYLIIDGLV